MSFRTVKQPALLLLIALIGLVAGCGSTQTARQRQAARSAAIGTWAYRVTGTAPLDQGTFSIAMKNGRLQATVNDRYRGRLPASVRVRPSSMELDIGAYRISGEIEGNRFTGFVRPEQYDASIGHRRDRSSNEPNTAYISAKRVQGPSDADTPCPLDCQSILREASGCR